MVIDFKYPTNLWMKAVLGFSANSYLGLRQQEIREKIWKELYLSLVGAVVDDVAGCVEDCVDDLAGGLSQKGQKSETVFS